MTKSQELVISRQDYENLSELAHNLRTNTGALLEEELARATIVDSKDIPNNVVTMGSIVSFIDETNNQTSTVVLLYPHEMNMESEYQKISVIAPVGAALIGLGVNQTIEWPLPNGKIKHLKVTSVDNRLKAPNGASL